MILCGIADDGTIQGMSREQLAALDHLLVEVSTDAIEPPLHIDVHRRELDGQAFMLVEVLRGEAMHQRPGRAFVRIGVTNCRLSEDERPRRARSRAQSQGGSITPCRPSPTPQLCGTPQHSAGAAPPSNR